MNNTNIMQRFNLRRLYPESLTDSLQPGSAQNTVLNIFFFLDFMITWKTVMMSKHEVE